MTPREKAIRMSVRNYLLTMDMRDMQAELAVSINRGDALRTRFVAECIDEYRNEGCDG